MATEDRDDTDPLQSLIAEILDAENRGETVNREKMVEQYPDHADSLRDFFATHDRMKSVAEVDPPTLLPAADSPLEDPTIPPDSVNEDPTIAPTEPASPDNTPVIGDKVRYFGDYELLEEIARGGMGVVYKARQANLNRIVALKMILAGQFAGEEDVQRFYTEAEAAASLDHPGIVPIFEIGEHAGQHYFSMGYIEGESLAQRVAEGPLPPREAAELAGDRALLWGDCGLPSIGVITHQGAGPLDWRIAARRSIVMDWSNNTQSMLIRCASSLSITIG